LNDHWGYFKKDCNYKSVETLLNDYQICRENNANFLLNIGPKGNGSVRHIDKVIMKKLGKKIKLFNV